MSALPEPTSTDSIKDFVADSDVYPKSQNCIYLILIPSQLSLPMKQNRLRKAMTLADVGNEKLGSSGTNLAFEDEDAVSRDL
jgi:hypothetical protein